MMISTILGRKVGMTQIFDETGKIIPVTVVAAEPCTVVQVKTKEKDGYAAVQVGLEDQKPQRLTKPVLGQFTKRNLGPKRVLKEIRLDDEAQMKVGQTFGVEVLDQVKWVDVSGTSKGKGFQGVMKRHNFSGGRNTHGSMFHRAPGSIGASSQPSRVLKGMRFPGQMGNVETTAIKLKLVKVDKEKNLLLIKGAIPGANRELVLIRKSNRGGKR